MEEITLCTGCINLVFIEDEPYCRKLEEFLPYFDEPLSLCEEVE